MLLGVPTNSVKSYCLGKFIKNLKSIDLKDCDIVFCDDTDDDDEYRMIIESMGFTVLKSTKTIKDVHSGISVPISQALANTRNTIREYFLKHSEYSHLMAFDSDIIMPKNTIPQLLSHGKDIVTGVYFQLEQGGTSLYPVVFRYLEKETAELGVHKFGAKMTIQELFPSRLIGGPDDEYRIAALGTGCVLISRKVLEDVRWSFRYDEKKVNTTEDMWWSLDMRGLGYEIYLDTSVVNRHHMKSWTTDEKLRPGKK